jgi:hypothetical protein
VPDRLTSILLPGRRINGPSIRGPFPVKQCAVRD